jgi:hypothetical protein
VNGVVQLTDAGHLDELIDAVEPERLSDDARFERDAVLQRPIIRSGDIVAVAGRRPPAHEAAGRLYACLCAHAGDLRQTEKQNHRGARGGSREGRDGLYPRVMRFDG